MRDYRLSQVLLALIRLGGRARLSDIYNNVEEIMTSEDISSFTSIESFKGSIRGLLERFSTDSLCYRGIPIFRKYGRGYWGFDEAFDFSLTESMLKEPMSKKIVFTWRTARDEFCIFTTTHIYFIPGIDLGAWLAVCKTKEAYFKIEDNWINMHMIDHNNLKWTIGDSYDQSTFEQMKKLIKYVQ